MISFSFRLLPPCSPFFIYFPEQFVLRRHVLGSGFVWMVSCFHAVLAVKRTPEVIAVGSVLEANRVATQLPVWGSHSAQEMTGAPSAGDF